MMRFIMNIINFFRKKKKRIEYEELPEDYEMKRIERIEDGWGL